MTDFRPPVFQNCPLNARITALDYHNYAPYSWPVVVALDPAAATPTPATVTLASSIPSGGRFPVGLSTVVLRASDAAGNVATCSFNVTVDGMSTVCVVQCQGVIARQDACVISICVSQPPVCSVCSCGVRSLIRLYVRIQN